MLSKLFKWLFGSKDDNVFDYDKDTGEAIPKASIPKAWPFPTAEEVEKKAESAKPKAKKAATKKAPAKAKPKTAAKPKAKAKPKTTKKATTKTASK